MLKVNLLGQIGSGVGFISIVTPTGLLAGQRFAQCDS